MIPATCNCGRIANYVIFVNTHKLTPDEVKEVFPYDAQVVMQMFIHHKFLPSVFACFRCCSMIVAKNAEDGDRKFSLQLANRFWERMACTG
jgi:hypothetical protein